MPGLCPAGAPSIRSRFSFLTLVVSLEAIFLSIFVLISQNNLTRQSERRAHLDLQINLLAEQESTKTVALLERIAVQLGVPMPTEHSDSELATPTDIREVVRSLDSVLTAIHARGVPTMPPNDNLGLDPERPGPPATGRSRPRVPKRGLDQIAPPAPIRPATVLVVPPGRRRALARARGLPDVERQDRRLHQDRPRSGGGMSRPAGRKAEISKP